VSKSRGAGRAVTLTSEMSVRVRRICAIGWSSWPKRLSYRAISRPCPIAAKACGESGELV
jgi:hypothetical protein